MPLELDDGDDDLGVKGLKVKRDTSFFLKDFCGFAFLTENLTAKIRDSLVIGGLSLTSG